MFKVAVVEKRVFDIPCWFARCMECDWQGKPREQERHALNDAKRHGAEHASAVSTTGE